MQTDQPGELERFRRGELDPASFRHADHVRLAFAMVQEAGFLATLPRYAGAIKAMAAKAGKLEAYNETVTTAFLSLIAERAIVGGCKEYTSFAASNADLFDKNVLAKLYSRERLTSPLARATFLLPDVGHRHT
jgi:hypothetical protein